MGGLIFLFVAQVKVKGAKHHTPRTKVAPHGCAFGCNTSTGGGKAGCFLVENKGLDSQRLAAVASLMRCVHFWRFEKCQFQMRAK